MLTCISSNDVTHVRQLRRLLFQGLPVDEPSQCFWLDKVLATSRSVADPGSTQH